MHLHHEWSMIGIQCQLLICRGHIRVSKVHFKFFCGLQFYGKLTFKSNFALWSSFQVKFERVVNGFGGQKTSQGSI